MKTRERFFIAFDISSDRRRSRLVRILERFGVRCQYSLFEFWLTPARKKEFFAELEKENFFRDDSDEGLLVVPIPENYESRIKRYGTTSRVYEEPFVVVL
jgi:CRISPR-associated endonuclease Cas2